MSESGTAKIETNNDFLTVIARRMEGKVWCKVSTTLRCGGDEALSFLLDVTSRSLLSSRDVNQTKHSNQDNAKAVLREKGHSHTVRIVEEMTEERGARYNNKIVRKWVWERKKRTSSMTMTNKTEGAATSQRHSVEEELLLAGNPTS